jgi:hypothetical protein
VGKERQRGERQIGQNVPFGRTPKNPPFGENDPSTEFPRKRRLEPRSVVAATLAKCGAAWRRGTRQPVGRQIRPVTDGRVWRPMDHGVRQPADREVRQLTDREVRQLTDSSAAFRPR